MLVNILYNLYLLRSYLHHYLQITTQALETYTGNDEVILDEIERQHPAYDITMTQAVQSSLDDSQNQKFSNGSDFRDWLVSISD